MQEVFNYKIQTIDLATLFNIILHFCVLFVLQIQIEDVTCQSEDCITLYSKKIVVTDIYIYISI